MDGADRPRPLGGPAPVHPARARLPWHQPADALGPAAHAGGGGARPAAQLSGVAATRRVRADRQGRGAPADHRGDEPVRPLLADRRAGHRPLGRARPRQLTIPDERGTLSLLMTYTTSS